MNDDELRAFLDSATVGGPGGDGGDAPAAPPAAGEQPEESLSFDELMGIRAEAEASAPPAPSAAPAPGAPQPPAAAPAPPAFAAPGQTSDDAELVPLVLPAPPTVRRPAASLRPQPPAAAPAQPRPEQSPVTAPLPNRAGESAAVPTAQMPAVPDPAPHPATDPLAALGFAAAPGAGLGADLSAAAEGGAADYEKIAVTGGEKKDRSRFVPWIIVGAGVLVALLAAVFVVFAVRGGGEPAPTAAPSGTETQETSAEPTSAAPTSDRPSETEVETPKTDEVPAVEVGPTGDIPIPLWGVSGQISAKFGWPSYSIDANNTLILEGGSLLPQFPESCRAMRTGFGVTKQADGSFEVHRPAETCAEAPELYDEVWGLTAAIVPTLKAG